MPVMEHIHTYARWQVAKGKDKIMGGEQVMKCIAPDCAHYSVKSLVIGKRSLCTKCGTEIILTKEALRRVNPTCLRCGKTKEGKALNDAGGLLDSFHLFDSEEIEEAKNRINQPLESNND